MKTYEFIAAIALTSLFVSCADQADEKEIPVVSEETQQEADGTKVAEPAPTSQPKKETHVELTGTEDRLIDEVWRLPEVKTLADKIERESKGKRHLVGRISSEPSNDQEYYGIAISEDNGEALATYYDFHIYPDHSIYYYDVIEDRELTLKEWRAQKK